MNYANLKRVQMNENLAKETRQRHDDLSTKFIIGQRKLEEKEKRETCYFFVSEIERAKVQIERLSKTGEIGDAMRCSYYTKIIAEKTAQMEAKFSSSEIEKAKAEFARKPNPFIFDEKQR